MRKRNVIQAKSVTMLDCNPEIKKNTKIKAGIREKTAMAI